MHLTGECDCGGEIELREGKLVCTETNSVLAVTESWRDCDNTSLERVIELIEARGWRPYYVIQDGGLPRSLSLEQALSWVDTDISLVSYELESLRRHGDTDKGTVRRWEQLLYERLIKEAEDDIDGDLPSEVDWDAGTETVVELLREAIR